ncbi:MAG: hypothetical protein GY729_15715 [Desulfobacteraceae bacterium]|nr:hypothetical protein [Desulfobacteraceae bacterium]
MADSYQLKFNQTSPFALYRSAKSLVLWSDSDQLLGKFKGFTCKKSYFYGEDNQNMPILKELDFA